MSITPWSPKPKARGKLDHGSLLSGNLSPLRVKSQWKSTSYAATPVTAFDQNAIDCFGLRIAPSVSAHEICDQAIANASAQLILQRGLYVRHNLTFKLSWEYCLLEPMDIVTVSDVAIGLDRSPIRILEIAEDDDGLLAITAEECPEGVGTAISYPAQANSGRSVDRNLQASAVNPPLIFEPPAAIAQSGQAEIWIGASGGNGSVADQNWGGAVVWVSLDGVSYSSIGVISKPLRQGVLAAVLDAVAVEQAAHVPFIVNDTAGSLRVDLSQSGASLVAGSDQTIENGEPLSLVGGELLAFRDVTLVSVNQYALSQLARGLYGSAQTAHAIGTHFARLDESLFKYVLPDGYIGRAIDLKLQSFNVFGAGVQDISECTAYTYQILGSGKFGGVAQALALGTNVDCGAASGPQSRLDDFGTASDIYATFIDLGQASS